VCHAPAHLQQQADSCSLQDKLERVRKAATSGDPVAIASLDEWMANRRAVLPRQQILTLAANDATLPGHDPAEVAAVTSKARAAQEALGKLQAEQRQLHRQQQRGAARRGSTSSTSSSSGGGGSDGGKVQQQQLLLQNQYSLLAGLGDDQLSGSDQSGGCVTPRSCSSSRASSNSSSSIKVPAVASAAAPAAAPAVARRTASASSSTSGPGHVPATEPAQPRKPQQQQVGARGRGLGCCDGCVRQACCVRVRASCSRVSTSAPPGLLQHSWWLALWRQQHPEQPDARPSH
jgi:hypothetical protein